MIRKSLTVGFALVIMMGTGALASAGNVVDLHGNDTIILARGGHGPGDGTGNGGSGPKDGTGHGPKTGDCVNDMIDSADSLIARGGNGNGGHGPGDGTGNGGNGPKDGTGHGPKTGDCVNSMIG